MPKIIVAIDYGDIQRSWEESKLKRMFDDTCELIGEASFSPMDSPERLFGLLGEMADRKYELIDVRDDIPCSARCPGWGVFNAGDGSAGEVQKCDSCELYASDDEAIVQARMIGLIVGDDGKVLSDEPEDGDAKGESR